MSVSVRAAKTRAKRIVVPLAIGALLATMGLVAVLLAAPVTPTRTPPRAI